MAKLAAGFDMVYVRLPGALKAAGAADGRIGISREKRRQPHGGLEPGLWSLCGSKPAGKQPEELVIDKLYQDLKRILGWPRRSHRWASETAQRAFGLV